MKKKKKKCTEGVSFGRWVNNGRGGGSGMEERKRAASGEEEMQDRERDQPCSKHLGIL